MAAYLQWQKDNDPTRLTDTEAHISDTIQKLLSMPGTNVPSHIEPEYLKRFKHLYGWLGFHCRVSDCRRALKLYKSAQERNHHEITHNRAYQCTDCSSVPNGFKTIDSLRKHREKYHMKPEDFKLPNSLVKVNSQFLNVIDI